MEIEENKTAVFYGDLVEVAMNKDIKRMVELADTLSLGQEIKLISA